MASAGQPLRRRFEEAFGVEAGEDAAEGFLRAKLAALDRSPVRPRGLLAAVANSARLSLSPSPSPPHMEPPGAGGAGGLDALVEALKDLAPQAGPTPNAQAERDWAALPVPALLLVARELAEGAERAAAYLPEQELSFGWSGDSSGSVLHGVYARSWGPREEADRQRDGLLCFSLCKSFRAAQN